MGRKRLGVQLAARPTRSSRIGPAQRGVQYAGPVGHTTVIARRFEEYLVPSLRSTPPSDLVPRWDGSVSAAYAFATTSRTRYSCAITASCDRRCAFGLPEARGPTGRATGDVRTARSRLIRGPPTARSIQRRPPARLRSPSVTILGPTNRCVLRAH